ncbi:MAG: NAD(P)H-hydrate dehydratase [Planctomycetota bacterium]|nr:MAG: NAD(P)H-hydrate dehydratase [Planctomycetota bacterium]
MGRALLVCGSRGMAGAAVLAAKAALRGGAGYAVLAAPGGISAELTAAVPSAVLCLCGGPERERLRGEDAGPILERAASSQALAAGPGLGADPDTGLLLQRLLAAGDRPWILDADALNLLAAAAAVGEVPPLHPSSILTPHPGEAARLLGWSGAGEIQRDRPAALAALIERYGCVVLLKGAGTLVGAPGHPPWTNLTGNPGMATAGSGDVLTGLIAALVARGLAPREAARLGAFLHGRAGDLAAAELGQESLVATDLLTFLPEALRRHPVEC